MIGNNFHMHVEKLRQIIDNTQFSLEIMGKLQIMIDEIETTYDTIHLMYQNEYSM
jgi:hypothetical protein